MRRTFASFIKSSLDSLLDFSCNGLSAIVSLTSSSEYSWSENKLKSGDLNSSRLGDEVNYGGVWATINQSIDSLHPNLIIPSLSMSLELRNGHNIKFWTINWIERTTLQYMFPHLFALETFKNYRCIEECFNDGADKWIWNAANSYVFLISNARHLIDNANLPLGNRPTKWSKFVPIVINIFA
ncbi:hypothetical protein Tco_1077575 [Tanacetum coccineum]